MSQNWYYTKDGKNRNGPVTAAQLKELVRSGHLLPTDMVKREDMQKWMPAASIQGLFPSRNQTASPAIPPPVPRPPVPPPPLPVTPSRPGQSDDLPDWKKWANGLLANALTTWRGWTWKVQTTVGGGAAFIFILMVLACGGLGGPSGKNGNVTGNDIVEFGGVDYSVPEVDYSKGPNGETIIRRRGKQDDPHAKKPYTESGFERNGTFVRHGQTIFWFSIQSDNMDGEEKFGEEYYFNGKMQGRRTAWFKSQKDGQGQKKFETTFLDDLQHGHGTEWYPDGQKQSETYWFKDQKHGPFQNWWENGQQAMKGAYKVGKEEGQWTYWHENGKLKAEKTYVSGEMDGKVTEYHPNGQKFEEWTAVKGRSNGLYVQWDEEGRKVYEWTFIDGKKGGKWTRLGADGKKIYEGEFDAKKWTGHETTWYSAKDGGNISTMTSFAKGQKTYYVQYYPAILLWRRVPIGPGHKSMEIVNGIPTSYEIDGSVQRGKR